MIRLAPQIAISPALLTFTQVAGGGPGGQHANKTASRVDLRLRLADLALPADAAVRLAALAGERLTAGGELLLSCDETRSARRNRALVVERLAELVVAALVRPAPRRRTRMPRGCIERRLAAKRVRGEVLRQRRDGRDDG